MGEFVSKIDAENIELTKAIQKLKAIGSNFQYIADKAQQYNPQVRAYNDLSVSECKKIVKDVKSALDNIKTLFKSNISKLESDIKDLDNIKI